MALKNYIMSEIAKMIEKYEIGKPTFLKFFNMPKEKLLKTLSEICDGKVSKETLEKSSKVYKTTIDDEPDKIEIHSWDSLEINPLGIKYKKEHGFYEFIIEFNKYFNLPIGS